MENPSQSPKSPEKSPEKNSSPEQSSDNIYPLPLQLNNVKDRLLFLSPTVRTGLERECNKNDFFRDGETYIGKGAFGEVWRVIQRNTNKKYVVKIMDKKSIKEQHLSDQINREIEIMYKLNHPHVMKLINHFEDNFNFYLLMPYASKGQLYTLLRKQVRFDQRTAAQYMREVIEAVKYIHGLSPKIIHRDIKPENLLLDDNYRVLLSDFGWSNFLEEGGQRKTFCGTPEYLSPEMAKKSGHNEMVDIWSLGVLLFEFLSGIPPFNGNNPEELYRNIKKLKINWPIDFPPLAKNLVSKILKLNPSERLSLDEILDHPWFSQNPPLKPVLTNYLKDEKDILKSHLILVSPESVMDKINDLTDPNKKRKFSTLRKKIVENGNDNNGEDMDNWGENKVNITDMNNLLYCSGVNESLILLKKEHKNLQKQFNELFNKNKEYEIQIQKLKEENQKLKDKQVNDKSTNIKIIEDEINKYKLISEDREKIINELNNSLLENTELTMKNELLESKINFLELKEKNLNQEILKLTKENSENLSKIEELSKTIEKLENSTNQNSNLDEMIAKVNNISENYPQIFSDKMNLIKNDFNNFQNNIETTINNKLIKFINEKDDLMKNLVESYEKNIPGIENIEKREEYNKVIDELTEFKKKSNNDYLEDKINELNNKNNILEEQNKVLSKEIEEYKVFNEVKTNESIKDNNLIKKLIQKIHDINGYIQDNGNDETFYSNICTIFNLNEFD